jgi:hypothetical protein
MGGILFLRPGHSLIPNHRPALLTRLRVHSLILNRRPGRPIHLRVRKLIPNRRLPRLNLLRGRSPIRNHRSASPVHCPILSLLRAHLCQSQILRYRVRFPVRRSHVPIQSHLP